jgi:hypothetical protein
MRIDRGGTLELSGVQEKILQIARELEVGCGTWNRPGRSGEGAARARQGCGKGAARA